MTHSQGFHDSATAALDAGTPPRAEIRELAPDDDPTAFRELNEEWITRYFVLEPKDREVLNNPGGAILLKGGRIFLAFVCGEPVGCVALIPVGGGEYELSKMAVTPRLRGLGIGRRILEHAIAQARAMGAASLFLGSNASLKSAIHLYESVGFRHVPAASLPPNEYTRANVFMRMKL
jgi:putative acetyltransferase